MLRPNTVPVGMIDEVDVHVAKCISKERNITYVDIYIQYNMNLS